MDDDNSVTCTVILGMAYEEREVFLVWINSCSLGILVRSEVPPFLLQLDEQVRGVSQEQLLALVLGTMGLMANCLPAGLDEFSSCLKIAVVMTCCESEGERVEELSRHISPDMVTLVMEKGWPHAQALVENTLSAEDKANVAHACLLFFPSDSTPQKQQ